jgi:hypothetical protein
VTFRFFCTYFAPISSNLALNLLPFFIRTAAPTKDLRLSNNTDWFYMRNLSIILSYTIWYDHITVIWYDIFLANIYHQWYDMIFFSKYLSSSLWYDKFFVFIIIYNIWLRLIKPHSRLWVLTYCHCVKNS